MTAATSTELQEALNGDRVEPLTIEQARLNHYWTARFYHFQWNWIQFRRGLLPTFNEAGMALRVATYFNDFRSVEGWWEARKPGFHPEFVEWVEEQRSKAA